MAVFAYDARSNPCEQLGNRAAFKILVGEFEDRSALASYGVFPYFADLNWCAVSCSAQVRMRHRNKLTREGWGRE